LVKQQGSLGFTLQKEDESVYGHFVRALVREPATTDGRIQPGDKIMAVNGVPVSDMTHEQAVIFLRQAPDMVKLRLCRDDGQFSLSATSPSDSDYRSYAGTSTLTRRTKPHLRPEAINLLSDLASKKNTQSSSTDAPLQVHRTRIRTTQVIPHSNRHLQLAEAIKLTLLPTAERAAEQ
jgi:hypothetical protein